MRTYAGEMLAWYLGGMDADVYFCPERQGTYFGSFFMKDIKAMNNPNYTIDSNMTADMGDAFLATLDATQKAKVTGLVTSQKADLLAIVAKRSEISTKLRNFLQRKGRSTRRPWSVLPSSTASWTARSPTTTRPPSPCVGTTLSTSQKTTLTALRKNGHGGGRRHRRLRQPVRQRLPVLGAAQCAADGHEHRLHVRRVRDDGEQLQHRLGLLFVLV